MKGLQMVDGGWIDATGIPSRLDNLRAGGIEHDVERELK